MKSLSDCQMGCAVVSLRVASGNVFERKERYGLESWIHNCMDFIACEMEQVFTSHFFFLENDSCFVIFMSFRGPNESSI